MLLIRRTLFLSLLLGLLPLVAQGQTPNAWINEFHYDDTGGGSDYVEIVVEDAGSVDLSKLDVELYRDSGTRYPSIGDVDSDFTQESTSGPFTIYTWTTTLQNGPADGLALCFNDSPLQVVSYEGTFTGSEDCASGETSTDIGVSENGSNANTTSLQLEGSGGSYSDFTWTGPITNTKGNVNTNQTLSSSVTITVDDDAGSGDFNSIQTAIDDANAGDVIEVKNGTYNEELDVSVNNLTITGASQNGVEIIPPSTNRGVDVSADDFTFKNATVDASNVNIYGIKVQGENPAQDASEDRADGLKLKNLTVQGSGRSEVDLNGVDNAVLEDLTLNGEGTDGNALALTDSDNATINKISSDGNNKWGGIALYAGGGDFTQGLDNVTITGNTPSEGIYKQVKNGFDVTNLELPSAFQHTLRNSTFRQQYGDSEQFTSYVTNQAAAIQAALDLNNPSDSYLQTLTRDGDNHVSQENNFIVGTSGGDAMSIQAALDAADPDATINVEGGGTYAERVTVDREQVLVQSLTGGGSTSAAGESKAAPSGAPMINGQVIVSANGVTVDGFVVSPPDATGNATAEAVRVDGGADNVTIENNTVKDFGEDGLPTWEGLDGIVAFGGNKNDPIKHVTISNNKVESLNGRDTKGGAAGISIQGNVKNATVTGNTVTNIGMNATAWAFGLVVRGTENHGETPSDVSMSDNDVSSILSNPASPYAGVGFGFEGGEASTTTVNNNSFSTTELQVEDKTVDHDLDNILANNTFDRAVVIRVGDGSGDIKEESLPDGKPVQRIYSPIAPAVDPAASGEIVDVFPGTYEEQVVVTTSDLTISGAGAGADSTSNSIIRSPTDLSYSFAIGSDDHYPIVGIDGATGVTVENVRVDGAGRGNNNYRFEGIAFWNAGGTVQNSYITGIRETPFSGNQHGVGVYANNNTGESYSVGVSGTTIEDFQKNGMALSGSGLTVDVDNNTVLGRGSISTTALNGIQVGNGATGSITNNIIEDIAYDGPTYASGAILTLLSSGTLTVNNNTISGSQVSLWFYNNSATIGGNDVSDPATVGVGSWGAILDPNGSDDLPTPDPYDANIEKSAVAKSASVSFTFDNNSLVGTDASGSTGVEVFSSGETLNATISKNLIKDFDTGIFVGEDSQNLVQSTTVMENCIVSNETYGLQNTAALTVQATSNYWGAASGPSGDFSGNGDPAVGNITVDSSPQKVGACPGGGPSPDNDGRIAKAGSPQNECSAVAADAGLDPLKPFAKYEGPDNGKSGFFESGWPGDGDDITFAPDPPTVPTGSWTSTTPIAAFLIKKAQQVYYWSDPGDALDYVSPKNDYSHLTFCVRKTFDCDKPTLAGEDVVDKENRTVSNTIEDGDGISEFAFTTLDNFTVVDNIPSGYTRNGDLDEAGVTWTWDGSGDPPEEVDFTLQAGPDGSATYFLEVTDACPEPKTVTFDPTHHLGSSITRARLAGNAPNPFSEQTTVEYAVPEQTRVTVTVYDMMGRKVATLVDNNKTAGTHTVTWSGRSDDGQSLASGVYLLRMQAENRSSTRRLTIVR